MKLVSKWLRMVSKLPQPSLNLSKSTKNTCLPLDSVGFLGLDYHLVKFLVFPFEKVEIVRNEGRFPTFFWASYEENIGSILQRVICLLKGQHVLLESCVVTRVVDEGKLELVELNSDLVLRRRLQLHFFLQRNVVLLKDASEELLLEVDLLPPKGIHELLDFVFH